MRKVSNPKIIFRKDSFSRNQRGLFCTPLDNTISLPCKPDPDYIKDFELYFAWIVDAIIHENLHIFLYNFINDEACTDLDNWMCQDFSGKIHEGNYDEWFKAFKNELKLRDSEAIKRITKKVKLGKKLSKSDYDRIAFTPYVRKKYYEVKYGE